MPPVKRRRGARASESEAPARRAAPAAPAVEEAETPARRPRGRFSRDGKVEGPPAATGRKLPAAPRPTRRRDEELVPPRRAAPALEPEVDEGRPRSPHPGFDRIRALAAQSRGRPERSQEETARGWGAREPSASAPRGQGPGGGGKGGPRRGPGGGGGKAPPRAKGPRRQR